MPEIIWRSPTSGELDLSSGHKARFRTLAGVVADDQHKSDTRVYSVGGGGYVGPHGGSVSAPQIRSATDKYQTIWITDAAGQDHAVNLTNMEVPLRVGQRVTVLIGGIEGQHDGYEVVVNHASQSFYNLAREVMSFDWFYRRYGGAGWFLRLLMWLTFFGMFLVLHESFQFAGQGDYRYQSVEQVCRYVPPPYMPYSPRVPRPSAQEQAQRYELCKRSVEYDNEKKRTAWHAWWVPTLSFGVWMLLALSWRSSSVVTVRQLRADYLGALDSWGRLVLARGAGR